MKKAQAPTPIDMDIEIMNIIKPHFAHLCCDCLNSSMVSHFSFCHAHLLPFAPRKNAQTKPKKGMNARKAIQVLFLIPQIQVSQNAPQFHPLSSGGNIADLPVPEVF